MEAKAILKHANMSPQKVRLVANAVRGQAIGKALNWLTYSPKKSSALVKKVLNSAIANAEHNLGADIDDLFVKRIFVDEGVVMKRLSARAKGRSNQILKRRSHITVIVSTKQNQSEGQ